MSLHPIRSLQRQLAALAPERERILEEIADKEVSLEQEIREAREENSKLIMEHKDQWVLVHWLFPYPGWDKVFPLKPRAYRSYIRYQTDGQYEQSQADTFKKATPNTTDTVGRFIYLAPTSQRLAELCEEGFTSGNHLGLYFNKEYKELLAKESIPFMGEDNI
jgi:hypothetical protein